jgi:DNA-binding response OmpR family regulator
MARILVVDDTSETCRAMKLLFDRHGHAAECVLDRAGVVGVLRAVPFDLVPLDVMMPGVDGFQVLAAIRADGDPRVVAVPVAMYSAVDDPREIERAQPLGANEWIVKGTPLGQVLRRLDACCLGDTVS